MLVWQVDKIRRICGTAWISEGDVRPDRKSEDLLLLLSLNGTLRRIDNERRKKQKKRTNVTHDSLQAIMINS